MSVLDEIERNIRRMSDEELKRMVFDDSEEYTEDALFIARDELKVREIRDPENKEPTQNIVRGDPAVAANPAVARKIRQVESLVRNREALIEAFLDDELQYLESCNAILDFVTSMNIRNGEYAGFSTVIRKMDPNNFILFAEGTGGEGSMSIPACVAVGREDLEDTIREIAKRHDIMLEEPNEDEDGSDLI